MAKSRISAGSTATAHDGEVHRIEELLLLSRIAGGDEAAFATLVDRFLPGVFRYAFSFLKAHGPAEDIAQEAFFRLWKASASWNPDVSAHRWLLKVTRNLCIDELRRKRPHEPEDDAIDEIPSQSQTQEALLSQKDVGQHLEQALLLLPTRQREALWLTYYEDMSGAEAASVMTITVDALESLLARGRKNMRHHLMKLKTALMEG